MNKTVPKLTKLPYFRTSNLEALLPCLKKNSIYRKLTRKNLEKIVYQF